MKQSEYLHELKENLEKRITPEELNDILSDYISFFVSGKEDGKTEDEISKELGSPAFLAKSLLEEHSSKELEQLDKRISSPGRRMCAYAIDAIIAVIPTLIVSLVIGTIMLPYILVITYPSPAVGASAYMSYAAIESLTETKEYEGGVLIQETWKGDRKPNPITSTAAVIALVFYLFHSLVCTLLLRGQTIGKKLMHIEVRRSNTGLAKSRTILGREFLGKMLMNSIPIIPLVYLCTILFTKEHKALHDMLADTIVIDV